MGALTHLHIFEYAVGAEVWALFFEPADTYKDGTFDVTADGGEFMRFHYSCRDLAAAHKLANDLVRSLADVGEVALILHH